MAPAIVRASSIMPIKPIDTIPIPIDMIPIPQSALDFQALYNGMLRLCLDGRLLIEVVPSGQARIVPPQSFYRDL